MSTNKIVLLSKIEFLNSDTYSISKFKLVSLHKLFKSSKDVDLLEGIFNKLIDVFIEKNKYIKLICIKIFKDIYYKVKSVDNIKIVRMFYQNDPEIIQLVLKFIKIFYRFFIGDEIIYYYLIKCNNKYSKKVLLKIKENEITKIKKYNKLENTFKYLYNGKIDKFLKECNLIVKQNIDYKFKCIICCFINKFVDNKNDNFSFEVTKFDVDESLICKINGYHKGILYKKLEKCYKNSLK